MSFTPFEGSTDISLDESQSKILVRLLSKQPLNPAEWRELTGLKEEIVEQLNEDSVPEMDVNSALFNNRSRF